MIIDLIGFNLTEIEKLEAYLREYKNASNFADTLYSNWYHLSDDFIREYKKEFIKVCNNRWEVEQNKRINFRYIRGYNFYKELFGEA